MNKKKNEVEMSMNRSETITKRGVLGFFIGIAIIIPGVSGSTIAIIFKMYDKILYSIANIFKQFKKSLLYLLPMIIGAALGVLIGFISLQRMIELIPFAIVSLFGGLMIGALPSLKEEIYNQKLSSKNLILVIFGALIPVVLCVLSIFFSTGNNEVKLLDVNIFSIVLFILLGFIIAGTQFIPGCSATAILMALGYFIPLLQSLHLQYIQQNPTILLIYASLFIGFILGCLFFSKTISHLISKYKNKIYFVFIGLSIGSVLSLFVNVNMIELYTSWIQTEFPILDIFLGCCLFISGLFISLSIVYYNKEKKLR